MMQEDKAVACENGKLRGGPYGWGCTCCGPAFSVKTRKVQRRRIVRRKMRLADKRAVALVGETDSEPGG